MAEEGGHGGGYGFFIGFFALIIVVYLFNAQNPEGLVPSVGNSGEVSVENGGTGAYTATPEDIEKEAYNISKQLEEVRNDLRLAQIWGETSPYYGAIDLAGVYGRGGTDPSREYFIVRARSNNKQEIPITGWKIESFVTGEESEIPSGTRLAYPDKLNRGEIITLAPGEEAIVVTGDSPIGTSFHENLCTGYFTESDTYYPSISRSCPSPLKDMERFGNIALDDDECYAYVKTLSSCRMPTLDPRDANIGSRCEAFVEDAFSYEGCVDYHYGDPYFGRGDWRVYLEKGDTLWRQEREIIRLLDQNGKTVDVVEY